MKLNFWILLFSLTSMLSFVSCGSNNDDDSSAAAPVPTSPTPPQNEEAPTPGPADAPNKPVRYSSVELYQNCGYWADCEHRIRADLNRRPVILTANFTNNGSYEEPYPEEDIGSCAFTQTLTEKQADKLEALADKVRTCRAAGDEVADVGDDHIILTERTGTITRANKMRFGYPTTEIYACKGARPYYNYVKTLIKGKVPSSCPSDYKWLFSFQSEEMERAQRKP